MQMANKEQVSQGGPGEQSGRVTEAVSKNTDNEKMLIMKQEEHGGDQRLDEHCFEVII